MKPARVLLALAAVAVVLGAAGCTANMRRARALSKARHYYAQGQYEKAEIEYMNVLQIRGLDPDAIAGLSILYYDEGRIGIVYAYLMKARELEPNNLDVRRRLAAMLLAAGNLKEAGSEAKFVLEHQPGDAEAPVLLAQTCTTQKDIAGVRQLFDTMPSALQEKAPVVTARGILDLRAGDVAGAELKFNQARKLDPNFSDAYLGQAAVYRARREPTNAEAALATAAKLSPLRSGTRLQYARVEVQLGHVDVARKLLQESIKDAPDCIPPYILLGTLEAQQQKLDVALDLATKALARDNTNPEAMTLKAHVLLAKGDKDKALIELDRAVSMYPQSAPLRFEVGRAAAATGDLAKAVGALTEAIRLNPQYGEAMLALAQINVRQNNFTSALDWLQKLAKQNPGAPEVQLAMADVYTRQGDFNRALQLYDKLEKAFPLNAQVPLLAGLVLVQEGRTEEARRAFERSLAIDPTFLTPLEQLADIDLRQKRFAAARERINAQIKLNPKAAGPYLILAKTYLEEGDLKTGEATLKKVIELQPDQVVPYMLLAQLYIGTKRQDEALASLQLAHKNEPKSAEPLMMIAAIYNQQKDYPKARDYYEKTLAVNPQFSAALNNLAYIYSEHLNNVDRAFTLAQRARELLPNEPHAADTLGWIVYKRGDYAWALSLLSESADRLPASAEVQFHVGMANYMLGQEQLARAALQRALKLNDSFNGVATAREALAMLDFNPATATSDDITKLESAVAQHPDPVALSQLAEVRERQHRFNDALAAYQAALKLSPKDARATLGMAKIYRETKEPAKALELAKAARKLAPTDPAVAAVLGDIVYDSGDFTWAASLLQEAVAGLPNDPEVLLAYADAAYDTGQISTARDAAQKALAMPGTFDGATDAKNLLSMIELSDNGGKAAASIASIRALLAAKPTYAPALMALGAAEESQKDSHAAIATYQALRSHLPKFAPAARRLAILLSENPGNDDQAAQVAASARDAYPDDADVAKAYGIIQYRRGRYDRAAALLEESSRSRSDDGEVFYYLGMSQIHLNSRPASVRSLRRALELNLAPELAEKVRDALAKAK